MMNEMNTDPPAELQEILRKSATDPEFRRELLTDPRGAIERMCGKSPAVRVVFVEKEPDVDALFVLPDVTSGTSGELKGEELEAVSGGFFNGCFGGESGGWWS